MRTQSAAEDLAHRQQAQEVVDQFEDNFMLKQSLRTQACGSEIFYVFLEKEVPCGLNYLAGYLENADIQTTQQDLDAAIKALKECINPENQDSDLGKYCTYIQQNRDAIPVEKLPKITEITARAVFKIKMPEHNNNKPHALNINRGKEAAGEIYSYSWGKIIGGLFLSIFLGAGIPLVLSGLREKKFNDYASRLFKPAVQKIKKEDPVSSAQVSKSVNRR